MSSRNRIEALSAGTFFVVRISVAKRVGGLHEAILLDYVVRWAEQSRDGWVFRTEQEIEEDTMLSRHHQRTARNGLADLGLIEEERRGVPARLYFRVNYDALHDLLGEDAPGSESFPSSPANLPNWSDKSAELLKETQEKPQEKKNTYTREFEEWWAMWPKKGDAKKPAFFSWKRLAWGDREQAKASLPRWLPYYASIDNKFIPNAATWLNQARYEVEPPPVSTSEQDYTKIPNLTAPPNKRTRIDWDELLPDGTKRYIQTETALIDRLRVRP